MPVLVRATAIGTLGLASAACGDDGTTSSTSVATTDVAPTAGPCFHTDPPPAECMSTGLEGTSTGSSSVADSATDVAPTAGPCAHDPDLPECASTTDGSSSGSDSGTATEGSTGTGTGTGTTSG